MKALKIIALIALMSLTVAASFNSADMIFARKWIAAPLRTPASSSETNHIGAICWDANYIYVWTATNVNKRAALSTW